MLGVIRENIGSIIVLAALILTILLILFFRVRAHRRGKGGCGCGCGCNACPMADQCQHDRKPNQK